ncbi:(Fe-S)-binding protein, partial [Intestinibacillus massiliensis]|nr:(Fe-S)-binding protein [Intestinibacillus massiliensis]
ASDPQYVLKTYQRICSHVGRVALLVDCCGAPALWSGDEEREGRMFGDFQKKWEALGQPKVIFACATCKKMMEEHIGGLKGEMVYTLLEKWRTPMKQQLKHASYAVFDPCSARHDDAVQQAVRSLSERAGAELLPIPAEKSRARCCGYEG